MSTMEQKNVNEYVRSFFSLDFQHGENRLAEAWISLVFGAFGGYMLTALPTKVLLLWEAWPIQFITAYVGFVVAAEKGIPAWWPAADAAIVVLLMQLMIKYAQDNYSDCVICADGETECLPPPVSPVRACKDGEEPTFFDKFDIPGQQSMPFSTPLLQQAALGFTNPNIVR